MIKEHTSIILTRDLPQEHLLKGDVGVIVHVHGNGEAYEVEFMTMSGSTVSVCTLEASDVKAVDSHMMPHVRKIAV